MNGANVEVTAARKRCEYGHPHLFKPPFLFFSMIEKHHGALTKGCESCFKGEKLVLFITGVCPRNCYYCPIGEDKKNQDRVFVNEWETSSIKDLIDEIKASGAKGCGITGGDPLARFDRTVEYIQTMKKNFGKEFHIHLYTSLDLLDERKIQELEAAGLDELRVHPDIFDKSLWSKLDLMKKTKMETAIEIPAFPKQEEKIFELIKFAKDKVQAFNLNELEYADLKAEEYKKQKWKVTESYSIEGSEKTAKNVIKKARAWHVRIHYCSAQFKDEVQFSGRLKNYAKQISLPSDMITNSGTLLRGAIFLSHNSEESNESLTDFNKLLKQLKTQFPEELFTLDKEKKRILSSPKFVKKHFREIPNCALIEEYPTRDKTEIYKEFFS